MMQYTFSKVESTIIDQLYFPLCAKIIDDIEREKSRDFEEFVPEDLIAIYKKMEVELKPFLKEIEKFYFETNSLASLFLTVYPAIDYKDVHAYLNFLKSLSEQELLSAIIAVLVKGDDDKAFTDENLQSAALYLDDELKQIKLLESMDIEGDEKWKLSSILRYPKSSVEQWDILMKALEPLYQKYYDYFEASIELVGHTLTERLNQTDGEVLTELTGGRVTKQLLPSGNLVIGFVKMFSIEIYASCKRPIIYWGIEVENVFDKLKEAEDSALVNRIQTFKNLGDKTRYEVLKCIASGMQSTKEIASKLGVSSATISYHLSHLTTSKLIKLSREDGKYISQINQEWIESCFDALKKDLKI